MEYIPHTVENQKEMMKVIGVNSFEELLSDIPESMRVRGGLRLPPPLSELELFQEMVRMAEKNADLVHYPSFLGAGAYDHWIPSAVSHIISRSEFYTSYTPYQAEMSQGLLQSIYEYQTMICEITGMEVANASLYDGASALAEAVLMAIRCTKRWKVLLSATIHPFYRQVVRTYLRGQPVSIEEIPDQEGITDIEVLEKVLSQEVAAVVIQHPNFFGCLERVNEVGPLVHREGGFFVVTVDPISLGLLAPPGEYGADIAVGEGQPLGIPTNFGGPYLGFFATGKKYIRQMPGRIVGATTDGKGNRGYCLTLQTREQHIRREKATSNICTNVALCALAATVYLATLGPAGLKEVAEQCLAKSHYAQERICGIPGYEKVFPAPFFKEFVVKTPVPPDRITAKLLSHRMIGGVDLVRFSPGRRNQMLFCVTEKRTQSEIDQLVEVLADGKDNL